MIPYWVATEDGIVHEMASLTAAAAPMLIVYPEVLDWHEEHFGSPVEWIAVDSIENVIWRRT